MCKLCLKRVFLLRLYLYKEKRFQDLFLRILLYYYIIELETCVVESAAEIVKAQLCPSILRWLIGRGELI